MANLGCVLESKDISVLTKIQIAKAMVFPIVMYRCESWTIRQSAEELMLSDSGAGEDS